MKVITGICLILGCFFGAGFVSGREIAFYFGRFGWESVIAIVVSMLLFFLLTTFFFTLSKDSDNFYSFSNKYFGKLSCLVNWLLVVCILIISSSMLAGTKSLAEALNINELIFILVTLISAFFVVLGNVRSLSNVNLVLLPILIIILMIVANRGGNEVISHENLCCAILNGGNYVFINIVTLGMFILEIGNKYSKKEKILISILSSLIIGIMLVVLNFAILRNGLVFETMPNLLLSQGNNVLYFSMQISIYLGLFTTLISNVLILTNFIDKYIKLYPISLIIVLLSSLVLSSFGFEVIVGYVYSFIGIVGVLLVISILIKKRKRLCFSV